TLFPYTTLFRSRKFMIRGIRGATTVTENTEKEITSSTKNLVEMMIQSNNVKPEDVSHIFFSATTDLNASFPAKAVREINGWTYVPVMCMQEMDVPNSLNLFIRIMMAINTDKNKEEIEHVFKNEAVKLRPDLTKE